MQHLCIVILFWQALAVAWPAVQGAGLNTASQTQSYETMLQNVRSGIFDDPDNPTELEAVLDSSRSFIRFQPLKGYE